MEPNNVNHKLNGRCFSKLTNFPDLIGESPQFLSLLKNLPLIAATNAIILIEGESGTGKELIAKAIHYNSSRSDKALICINCGAIPESLIESEFFGYQRGAFTGAIKNAKGKFEAADGGTIFLDEVGELAPPTQVKLLRVLQWGEFTPLGTNENRKSDVRIIAATNCNLKVLVEKGIFRADLYYRLNVVSLQLPPLRERRADLPLLMRFFLDKFYREYGRHPIGISPSAEQLLLQYNYPGNIRELENIIQRAVLLSNDAELGVQHLPEEVQNFRENDNSSGPLSTFSEARRLFELRYLEGILSSSNGVIREAARLAGMDYKNFYMKLKCHNINPNAFKSL